jgi:hypothetical protein
VLTLDPCFVHSLALAPQLICASTVGSFATITVDTKLQTLTHTPLPMLVSTQLHTPAHLLLHTLAIKATSNSLVPLVNTHATCFMDAYAAQHRLKHLVMIPRFSDRACEI